ncbi:MAG: hypothetical protein BRC26_03470, partial [Nanohaloarchaea archaeon QH_8_44_6]
KEIELYKNLGKYLGDDIDIVVMNKASNLINYNIISDGKIVHCSSPDKKAEIESSILRSYLDMKYYQDRHVEERLQRFAEKGLA